MKKKKGKQRYWINGKAYRKIYVIRACFKALRVMPYETKENLVEAIQKLHPEMNGSIDSIIVKYATNLDKEGLNIGRPIKRTKLPAIGIKPLNRMSPDDFYRSREWLHIRYQALKNNGARCQCCGATRADDMKLHVDHIKPRSLYPDFELCLDNLQVLCEDCNLGKSNIDQTDWRSEIVPSDEQSFFEEESMELPF